MIKKSLYVNIYLRFKKTIIQIAFDALRMEMKKAKIKLVNLGKKTRQLKKL